MWGENSGVAVCLMPNAKCLGEEISKPGGEGDSRPFPRRWELVEGGLCAGDTPATVPKCCVRGWCCLTEGRVVPPPWESPVQEQIRALDPFSFEVLGTRGADWDLNQFRWAMILWITRLPHSVCSQSCCGHKGQAEGAHLGNASWALSSGLRMVFCQENCPDGALCCLQLLSAAVCMAEEVGGNDSG